MFPKAVSRDLLIISSGPFASALFSVLIVFIVSWNFSAEILGSLAILELCALLFVMIFTFGLDQAYVREHATAPNRYALFAAAVRIPAIAGIVAAASAAVILPAFKIDIFSLGGRLETYIAAVYAAISVFIRMFSVVLRMTGPSHTFALLQPTQRAAAVIAMLLLLGVGGTRDLASAMLCYLAGAVVSLALHMNACRNLLRHAIGKGVDVDLRNSLLRFGIPAAFAAFLYALLASSDRISLALLGSPDELGIYAVALSVAGSVNILTAVFSLLWAPMIYANEERARDPSKTAPYLEAVTLLTFLAGGGLSAISWLLPFALPAEYANVPIFVPACVALPLFYILSEAFGVGIGVSRRMGYATLASAFSAMVALGVCVVMVPTWGSKGAAFGILAGACAFLLARTEIGALLWCRMPSKNMYITTSLYVLGSTMSLTWGAELGDLLLVYWFVFCFFTLLVFRRRLAMFFVAARESLSRRA